MKTRDTIITEFYEQQMKRLLDLSVEFQDKPKKGYEDEWQDCKENLEVLEQMLLEIPMDYIIDGKETGRIKQEFVGTFENQPKSHYNCDDHEKRYFYINMIIKGCGDEDVYRRVEPLRLSHKVWYDWFFNFRYEEEKEQRIDKNLCTYVKAIMVDGEVTKLKWYRRYNPKK